MTPSESAVKVHSKAHQVTVTYDGSDTITSCSYTTLPDNSARRRLCPTRGVVSLLDYSGWSLTTWVVKVALEALGLTKVRPLPRPPR